MTGRGRIAIGLGVFALFSALLAAIPVAATAGGGSFADDDGSIFEADIEWLAAQGITRGCNPPANDKFCPDTTVTRGQMAAFLVRALSLPAATKDHFVDDEDSIFEGDINRLAESGITKGCNPPTNDRFCPDGRVTRGQMAAFLVRALKLTDEGFGNPFADDNDSIFENDITKLAAAGITKGCNPPLNSNFCPSNNVTRGQMAAFLRRALSCSLPGKECEALEAIYDSMGGTSWIDNSGWETGANPCTWKGIQCLSGQVETLDLIGNGLAGPVPAEIRFLTQLRKLKLTNNKVSGSIPIELTTMTSLREIRMGDNKLTGNIPVGFGSLPELRRFELGRNSLTGPIPPDIADPQFLNVISLSDNNLTGSIPPAIGNMPALADLSLDGNNLTGTIPAELGNLPPPMFAFSLARNDLSGEVPASLQNLDGTPRFKLNGQSGCLTAADPDFADWLTAQDPIWADGC